MGIYINFMSLRAADAVSGVALIVDTWVGALLCPHCSMLIFVTSCILFLIFSCLGGLESGLQGSEARAYLFLSSVPQHWAQSSVRGRYIWCTQGAPPTVLLFVTLWVV